MRKKRTRPKTTKNKSAERLNEIFNRGWAKKFLTRLIQFKLSALGYRKARAIASIAMNQAVTLNVLNRPPLNAIKEIKENSSATINATDDRKKVASCEAMGIF